MMNVKTKLNRHSRVVDKLKVSYLLVEPLLRNYTDVIRVYHEVLFVFLSYNLGL